MKSIGIVFILLGIVSIPSHGPDPLVPIVGGLSLIAGIVLAMSSDESPRRA